MILTNPEINRYRAGNYLKYRNIVEILIFCLLLAVAMLTSRVAQAATPSVILSSNVTYNGDRISVSGTGFSANANVNVTFDWGTIISTVTSSTGSFTTSFTIPTGVYGGHVVKASDGISNVSVPLSIQPIIFLSSASGQVGSTTTVTGNGFSGSATVNVSLEDNQITQTTTDSSGSFRVDYVIPANAGGIRRIIARDSAATASTEFTLVPSASLSRSSGSVGDSVTVSGNAFGNKTQVSVTLEDTEFAKVETDTSGSFSISFTLPATSGGTHSVVAKDDTFSVGSAFTILSSIKISPASGKAGTQIVVSGTGFGSAKSVTILLDGAALATVNTDTSGNFNATTAVPPSAAGNHIVSASDNTSTANGAFSTIANMALSLSRGAWGVSVNITGTGFVAGSTVTTQMGGTVLKKTTANETGSFSDQFAVPPLDMGKHTVTSGDGINSADTAFTITVGFGISPNKGQVGSSIAVSGTGFRGTVDIKFDDASIATAASDANGTFSTTCTVPTSTQGTHTISANDAIGSLQSTFTVTSSFSISPTTGHVGSSVVVSGTGFKGTVDIKFNDSVITTAIADASGAFSATFTVPASTHGAHIISVNDADIRLQTNFTIDSTPPPVPTLLQPETVARQGPQPTLTWGQATDPSGVTYTLQVTADASFTTLILEKQGLTVTQYRLANTERLPTVGKNMPFYWRVKAVDLARNESDWSTSGSFYVTALPLWIVWALAVLGAVALGLFIFWFVLRLRRWFRLREG